MSWRTAGDLDVRVLPDGRLTVNGNALGMIDGAGRVYRVNNEPAALLLSDGTLEGPGRSNLGNIGVTSAVLPDRDHPWLSVLIDGQVVRFDGSGLPTADGRWQGCDGPQHRTCTLVTHLFYLQQMSMRPRFHAHH